LTSITIATAKNIAYPEQSVFQALIDIS